VQREGLICLGRISLTTGLRPKFICSYKLFTECVFIESNEYNTQNIHSILYEFIQTVKFVNIQPSDLLVIKGFLGNQAVCNQFEC